MSQVAWGMSGNGVSNAFLPSPQSLPLKLARML
jgi:hypothetical protein